MEMVAGVGQPATPSELPPQVVAAWRRDEIIGVASLRPSLVLDFEMTDEALDACLPFLVAIESGLIKSDDRVVAPLWAHLRARGRRALIDRGETSYVRGSSQRAPADLARPAVTGLRPAVEEDLDDLVFAARASLREEDRPDPFDGDPVGFRRWVRGRLHRARVLERAGQIVFVGYADVRRPEGWLIQGVYTWPEHRRRGFAAIGVSGLVEEAFCAGAGHVQLAVVDGNLPAVRLYERLGFVPFAQLRTLVFL